MTAKETLKRYFSHDSFRGEQETLITEILAGKDVLGIMPTGAGKSICFQVPALIMEGITLVVSPLISLMKDQVNALTQLGIAAAYINSSLTEVQIEKALRNAHSGAYKLIYVAPERLLTANFINFAKSVQISMLVIDEAHCISQWGHDFRPSYAQIPEFIANLPKRPLVTAFTATATPKVQDDIINLLQLDKPTILVTGFDRPNLYFEVQKPENKFSALLAFLEDKENHSGIVYCSSRAAVEGICQELQQKGYKASCYHAGLSDEERHDNQDDFLYDRVQVMVATNAFGLGINKPNIDFIVHYHSPKNIESYYQEAGRAGRDGRPAVCVLFYSGLDVRRNMWMIEKGRESKDSRVFKRDRAKLREMTLYCTTYDCLRGHILKYFGENPPRNCGHCSNCDTNFDAIEISSTVLKTWAFVVSAKEKLGRRLKKRPEETDSP